MPIYFATFTLLAVASFTDLITRSPRSLVGILVTFCIISIVGLRYMSVDYEQYWHIYDKIEYFQDLGLFTYAVSDQTPIESGFAFLILAEKHFIGEFFAFIFIFSVISVTIKYIAFIRLSPFVLISFIIYFSDEYFWKDMSQIRNAMASGMVLLSIYYVYERNFLKFIIFVGLAGFVHSFAWAAVPFYFVSLIAGRRRMAGVLAVSFAVGVVGGIGLLLPQFAAVLGFDPMSRLIKYTDSEYVGGGRLWGGTTLLHIAISAVLIFYYKKLSKVWSYNIVLIPIYVCGTSLMLIFQDYGILWGRSRELFCMTTATVILPSTILLFRGVDRVIPYTLILAYCCLWFYLMIRDRDPYQSILQFLA